MKWFENLYMLLKAQRSPDSDGLKDDYKHCATIAINYFHLRKSMMKNIFLRHIWPRVPNLLGPALATQGRLARVTRYPATRGDPGGSCLRCRAGCLVP